MKKVKDAVARGRARLLQMFPLLLESSSRVTQHQADALGMSLEEFKEVVLLKSLSSFAKAADEDLIDLLIRYGADSEEEANALMARRKARVAAAMQEGSSRRSA